MTAVRTPALYFSLAFSGSVHLGLLAILAFASSRAMQTIETIDVSFVERHRTIRQPAVVERKVKSETVQAPAPAAAESAQVTQSQPVPETDVNPADQVLYDEYTQDVARQLKRNISYPDVALKLRQQGKVKVRFRVDRSGKILNAEILEASAFEALNRAAKSLIEEIRSFRPFPDDVKETTWLFTVPIEYRL